MPRRSDPRGGARQGTPGKTYGNRTDLARNRAPVNPLVGTQSAPKAATGLPYGEHGALVQAQRQIPTATQPPVPPGQHIDLAAQGVPLPGSIPSLTDPTNRPNEPVTAGVPSGPGPGPAPFPNTMGAQTAADLFDQLASGPGSNSAVAQMAAALRSGQG